MDCCLHLSVDQEKIKVTERLIVLVRDERVRLASVENEGQSACSTPCTDVVHGVRCEVVARQGKGVLILSGIFTEVF